VYPLEVGDAADLGTAIGIDDFHFCIVRNVEPTRGGIKSEVVPIFLATQWSAQIVFLDEMVASLGSRMNEAAK
jgi:hypothetical protein